MSDPRHPSRTGEPILAVDGVSVRFGGVQALDSVELTAYPGRVTGLIGPNGAGKTTLFNVITGLEKPNHGRIRIDGEDVTRLSPYRRARLGIGRTFQRLEVFGSLTARGNILAAAEFRNTWARTKRDPKTVTEAIIERVGLGDVAENRVDAMPTGLARLVELARALAARPRLLLLDEPGSGLNHEETQRLAGLLLELVSDTSADWEEWRDAPPAILLVEHDVELVMKVCTQIYVLDFGRIIAVGPPAQIQADASVQAAYLGADTSADDAMAEVAGVAP